MRGRLATVVVVVGAFGFAACSSGPKSDAGGGSTPPGSVTASTALPTTTITGPLTSDLVVTDAVRSQLIAAGAALNQLSPSDYTGLRPGETYYAYDADTKTYWASAGLSPSASSTPAQVASQDDGAYLLFERPAAGAWTAYAVGLAGTPEGSACPVTVPVAILDLWGWSPGTCRPAVIN